MLTDFYQLVNSGVTGDSTRDAQLQAIRTALAGRFSPDIIDEAATVPAASFTLIDNRQGHQLDGTVDGLYFARVQIDIVSKSAAQNDSLGKSFRIALDGLTGLVIGTTEINSLLFDNDLDMYDGDRKQYRKIIDFRLISTDSSE